ncbi:FAD-dependent oxidoreductase [Acidianus manzaensis]|uniref:Pyridine nucleotide-disulfide oxidoreductase n=1 Tax=Acidianus manzaensis TaxID=282676 RepID=A0A1W6JZN9_9CREN|nr:NAD(P)/FAD-dependent oxidoreductase [Acidianus manzaensis]ARM75702.1 pyridine nucleotide-disulfide oxidoreductase [Acidianus manzaensis]
MNITVIGSGPAGLYAALAASKKAKVTLIEKNEKLGGTCVLYGCIPSKAMIHPLSLSYSLSKLNKNISFNFLEVQKFAKNAINRLSKGAEYMLENNGVEVIHASAELRSGEVNANNQSIHSDAIIVATGTSKPEVKGTLASDDLPYLDRDFNKVVVIGGGAGGLEYAWLLHMAGKEVSIVEKSNYLMPYLDDDMKKSITSFFSKIGVKLYLNSEAKIENNKIYINENEVNTDIILYTFGRNANIKGFEELPHEKWIKVDERMYTGVRNIYAAGDITGSFTAHEAIHKGYIAGLNAIGIKKIYNSQNVPKVIYTEPQIAYVGKIEGTCVKVNMAEIGRAITEKSTDGFLKVCKQNNKIIGAEAFSHDAEEIITTIASLMTFNVNIEEALDLIIPHPSYLESIWEALLRLQS